MTSEQIILAGILVAVAAITAPSSYLIYHAARRIQPSDYAVMERTMADMDRRLAEMREQQRADHRTIAALQVRVTEMEIGVRILVAQIQRAGDVPEWSLAPASPERQAGDDRALKTALAALFNKEELDDLAFQVGIDSGEISGDTMDARARALVTYARRHGQLAELVAAARRLRPEGEL